MLTVFFPNLLNFTTQLKNLILDGTIQYSFEFMIQGIVQGIPFRKSVFSVDENFLISCTVDKKTNKDCIAVYDAGDGELISRMPCFIKNIQFIVPMPQKSTLIAVVSNDKCCIIDIKAKQKIRALDKWNGNVTNDGKFGLYSPTRGGLQLIDIRKGTTVKTFIPKVAEGIVSVICLFTENDEYVCYYHTKRRTLRVFRISDTALIANYRLQAELTAIKSSKDGQSLVLGTVDGCLSVFAIADPAKKSMISYLSELPSRDETLKTKFAKNKARIGFRAAIRVVKISRFLNRSVTNSDSTIIS